MATKKTSDEQLTSARTARLAVTAATQALNVAIRASGSREQRRPIEASRNEGLKADGCTREHSLASGNGMPSVRCAGLSRRVGKLVARTSMMVSCASGFLSLEGRMLDVAIQCRHLLPARRMAELGVARDHFPAKMRIEKRDNENPDEKRSKE